MLCVGVFYYSSRNEMKRTAWTVEATGAASTEGTRGVENLSDVWLSLEEDFFMKEVSTGTS